MGASTDKHFISQYKNVGTFADSVKNDDIKNEPMFFNCDFNFAMEKGGDITKSFLNALPESWKEQPLVFDSRVHMLMPGWFPAIPGWHHDDVPRAEIPVGKHFITAGQPDYDNPKYKSEHILGLVNADVCPTLFATGHCTMPAIPEGELIYRAWHLEVEKLINEGVLQVDQCKDRTLCYFDWETFHTGTKAVANGWRWFGRVSRNTERIHKVTNEIRVNAQVYLEFPMEGW
jgi:hypothetical protein